MPCLKYLDGNCLKFHYIESLCLELPVWNILEVPLLELPAIAMSGIALFQIT